MSNKEDLDPEDIENMTVDDEDADAIAEAVEAEKIVAELSEDPDLVVSTKKPLSAGTWFYCTRCYEPSLCRAKCRPDPKDRIPLKAIQYKDAIAEVKNNGWELSET